jgi:cyclophilin family peptidyl-prolyl cis-trans isomerase
MPSEQSRRRKKRYEPGSAYAGKIKPVGVIGFLGSPGTMRIVFFIMALALVVGGAGALLNNWFLGGSSPSNASDNFVKPDDSAGTGTPDAKPTITIRQYTSAPALTIDPSKKYVATIKTDEGDIQVELLASNVPQTVNNFVFLAKDGFYDGLIFHQVASGFDAQAGDPSCMAKQSDALCRGSGGAGYDLPQEKPGDFQAGDIGMANSSQFFFALDASPQFSQYTPFGKITSGLDVAKKIAQGTAITSIEISEQ